MSVTSLDDYRPHRSGPAKCCNCHHIWTAVAPVNNDDLECPECGLCKGVWYGLHMLPDDVKRFTCECQNTFFEFSPDGPLCANCGNKFTWDDI